MDFILFCYVLRAARAGGTLRPCAHRPIVAGKRADARDMPMGDGGPPEGSIRRTDFRTGRRTTPDFAPLASGLARNAGTVHALARSMGVRR
ncbi:hypothetical protein KL86PLE_40690 [uncultured Pleomorphomonas sp.]|uniref:Uncharacterized protein n=1 Tax=uncultured Pleomorphomonas sp. TaxID=442121 RepID=A0A212LH63_9HYPH|nr:hypothetical protein KL86PLE_40690 [uncultured Pleomorphomonas sp.]